MTRGEERKERGKDKMRGEERVSSRDNDHCPYVSICATKVESLLFESSLKQVKKLWICLGKIRVSV